MLDIFKYPFYLLSRKMPETIDFDKELEFFSHQMFETMYKYRLVGLSANQVGLEKRMFVMDCGEPLTIINPKIININSEIEKKQEACCSFSGFHIDVERSKEITISYQDLSGNHLEKTFKNLGARCVLHEFEHINGESILKHVPLQYRLMIERSLREREVIQSDQ